jgi:hypothetical protein
MAAVFYSIGSYETAFTTGSRKSNYHCYCLIFDEQGQELKGHALRDVFYGKWPRCETVIKRWQKAVDKAKLQRLKTNPPPAR